MQHAPRLAGTLAVLAVFVLIASPVLGAAPAGSAPTPGAPLLAWLQESAVRLGLLPLPGLEHAEPRPEPRASSSTEEEADLTTLGGGTCEPASTERDCTMDPDG